MQPSPSDSAALARRYRRLLYAFSAQYRRTRGEEIVATFLDLARPGQRRPTVADAADLIGAGLRQRLGLARVPGFDAGLTIAAPIAMSLAAGLSAYVGLWVEPIVGRSPDSGHKTFGPMLTLGPLAYMVWLIAAAAWVLPNPRIARRLTVAAMIVTALVTPLSGLTGYDRPPLWVTLALLGLGALSLAGTSASAGANSQRRVDDRLAVPAGAAAVALVAVQLSRVWPADSELTSSVSYYQPTIARCGAVVAGAVGVTALVAIFRAVSTGSSGGWLWATLLLALPGGWLGPFDNARWRGTADQFAVPHFGRLAQVILATCVVLVAMAWLARPGVRMPVTDEGWRPTAISRPPHERRDGGLRRAGAVAVGFTAGLAGFLLLVDSGVFGPPARSTAAAYGPFANFDRGWCLLWLALCAGWLLLPARASRFVLAVAVLVTVPIAALATPSLPGAAHLPQAPPLHLVLTFIGLAGAALVAGSGRLAERWRPFVTTGVVTLGLSVAVGAYDNGWRLSDWQNPRATTVLVSTLALAPFALLALTAADAYTNRRSRGELVVSVAMLAIAGGWLAYVAVPYLLSWGPVLLLLAGCGAVVALPQLLRRRQRRANQGLAALAFLRARHDELTGLAEFLVDRADVAHRLAGRSLVRTFRGVRYLPDEQAITRRARQHLIQLAVHQPVTAYPPRQVAADADPVWLAVRRLPGLDRAAWVLHVLYQLPVAEIADILQVSQRSAERILARAEAAARVAPLASLLTRQSQ